MLDGHDLVVADEAEIRNDVAPKFNAVTVADGTEDPGSADLIAEGLTSLVPIVL